MHRRLWASWWSCDACDASWWSCDACDACEARNAGTHARMRYACDARVPCGARLARGARGVCGAPAASGSRATLDRQAVLSWSTASTLGPADCSPPARSSFLVSSDPDFLRSPCLLASCPSCFLQSWPACSSACLRSSACTWTVHLLAHLGLVIELPHGRGVPFQPL